MTGQDIAAHARALLDANAFLTLGTVDPDGRPWTSPVYFAASGLREFYWCSETDAVHSRNLTERPHVSIVVFDSSVRPYHGRALYAVGLASELDGDDLDHGLRVYPGPSERGGTALTRDDVTGSAPYRLYRATATDLWVLCPREPGQPCPLHGLAKDHRTYVELGAAAAGPVRAPRRAGGRVDRCVAKRIRYRSTEPSAGRR